MTSRVGERGQITIEKAIREELGIYAGDETVQRVEDGRIVIEVVPGRHSPIAGGEPEGQGRPHARPTSRGRRFAAPHGRRRTQTDSVIGARHLGPGALLRRHTRGAGSTGAELIDGADEIGVSPVALAECAHVLRTQYDVAKRDILDSLIGLVQRANVRVLGTRTDALLGVLVRRENMPGRPIPDALIVADSLAADALPLATFDRDQQRYGIATLEP